MKYHYGHYNRGTRDLVRQTCCRLSPRLSVAVVAMMRREEDSCKVHLWRILRTIPFQQFELLNLPNNYLSQELKTAKQYRLTIFNPSESSHLLCFSVSKYLCLVFPQKRGCNKVILRVVLGPIMKWIQIPAGVLGKIYI